MSRFDERRASIFGESHQLPEYISLLKSAIEHAVGSQRDVHVKVTMQSADMSLSVEITFNPSSPLQLPQIEPPAPIEQIVNGIVIGQDNEESGNP